MRVHTHWLQERPGPKDDTRHPKWQAGGCKHVVILQDAATQVGVICKVMFV